MSFVTAGGAQLRTTGQVGWNDGYYLIKRLCCLSATLGTAWAYNFGLGAAAGHKGWWKTTDWGATWTQAFAGTLPGANGFDFANFVKAREMPGYPGRLYMAERATAPLERSLDGGTHWGPITVAGKAVTNVQDFDWCAPLSGEPYPAMLFSGSVDGKFGVWETRDEFASVTQLTTDQVPTFFGVTESVNAIAGNPSKYGEWAVGYGSVSYVKVLQRDPRALL